MVPLPVRAPLLLGAAAMAVTFGLAHCTSSQEAELPTPVADELGRVPLLVCPGGPGCREAAGPLLVGAAKRVITPLVEPWTDTNGNGQWDRGEPFEDLNGNDRFDPVYVAGFGMNRVATEIHDDIWVRAISLRRGDTALAVVAVDLVGYFHDEVVQVRQALRDAGAEHDQVVIASTHNHEGPDTMGIWGPGLTTTGVDPEYMARVRAAIVEAVLEAARGEAEARLTVAQTDVHLIHDSRLPEVIDPQATAVAFSRTSGEPIAHLLIWGNHPEALGGSNTAISSDYPHYAREVVEAAAPGTVAVFFAGTLGGLMNPLHVVGCPDAEGRETCRTGTFEKAEYIGRGLAEPLLAALAAASPAAETELSFRRQPLFMPIQNLRFVAAFAGGLLERNAYGPEQKRLRKEALDELLYEEIEAGAATIQSEVNALRIGPLELMVYPGELYPELYLVKPDGGSYIEHPEGRDFPDAEAEAPLLAVMPAAPFRAILNNANDAIGYIIPKPQFDRAAPRAYKPNGQYGEENSLGYDAARLLLDAVRAMYAAEPR